MFNILENLVNGVNASFSFYQLSCIASFDFDLSFEIWKYFLAYYLLLLIIYAFKVI